MKREKPNKIWVDADACPKTIKEIIFKLSKRTNINVILVANSYQNVPNTDLIKLIVVDKGFDAADMHIIDQVEANDIVVSADIPLVSQVLKKKAIAINPRGEIYSEDTIASVLSIRDFMKEFYDAGTITGGQAPFGPKDVKRFGDSLNKVTS